MKAVTGTARALSPATVARGPAPPPEAFLTSPDEGLGREAAPRPPAPALLGVGGHPSVPARGLTPASWGVRGRQIWTELVGSPEAFAVHVLHA